MKIKRFNESINENDEIPSAVDFLHNFTDNPNDDTVFLAMVGFAKLHVEKALKRSHSNMQLPSEDLEFTLQSYPLENIKIN